MSNLFTPPHLLLRRRQMMMSKGVEMDYITDGLIFHLDAIDKGGDGTTWVDKIGGIVFDNHGAVFGSNYVEFDGTGYLEYTAATHIANTSNSTIEIVLEQGSKIPSIAFMQNYRIVSPCVFGYDSSTSANYTTDNVGKERLIVPQPGKIHSISNSMALVDGTERFFTGARDYWGVRANQGIVIGARTNTLETSFVGKIYSIRIYNRELTTAEMIANQRVDNTRFNLGLSI